MMRAVLVVVALAGIASAQPNATQTYRVKAKDTLDVIAAEFYGDRDHAIYIVTENKLKDRKVRPFERLRIPVTREITTDKGDTFESLAHNYLGDARRAVVLADYNNMAVEDAPARGIALTIPVQLTHVASEKESLAQIATQYFSDAKQADQLRKYNFLDKTTLEKGDSIVIPLLHVRVRPAKLPAIAAEAKERRELRREAVDAAAAALPGARTAWVQGDFANVRSALEAVAKQLEYLDTAAAIEVGLLLARSHVAYDDTTAAIEVFKQMIDRKPSHRLTAYAESPKVIDAWKKAGGQLRE